MLTRRDVLKWGAATGAGLLVPYAYQQGRALSSPLTKTGLYFGYQPFTQPLFIPDVLTPLTDKDGNRLSPAPGAYPRGNRRTSGRPMVADGTRANVAHGIAPEFGHAPEWNAFNTGFSRGDTHEQEFQLVTEETTHRYVPGGPDVPVFTYRDATKASDPVTLLAPVLGGEFDTTWIPSTLWYHDHAMDITGYNVIKGLAGFYLVFDDRQREFAEKGVIPPIGGRDAFGNPLDIGLALQDQRFNPDGTLFYDFLDHNGRPSWRRS